MDMRDFAPKKIGPDEVRDGSIQTRVLSVFENEKTGRPVLELENGSTFMLNVTNCNILIKAWGIESDDWKEREIEFSLATYKDFKTGEDKETVRVSVLPTKAAGNGSEPNRPALPPSRGAAAGAHASLRGEMDDDIPFASEWR